MAYFAGLYSDLLFGECDCFEVYNQKVDNHIRSLAFPSISTGVYAFPVEEAARIAIDTVKQFVKEYPGAFDVIKWVLYDNNTLTVYDKALSLSDAADIVHSPVFDAINRMLRNGRQ